MMIPPSDTATHAKRRLRAAARRRAIAIIGALGVCCVLSTPAWLGAGETPPEAEPPDTRALECPSWTGTIVGNATATVTLELCSTGASTVAGTLVFSSPDAGLSERRVNGEWAEDNLVLQDVEMVVNQPNPGWRFCLIDSYRLHRTATGSLLGEYDSKACNDHASVALAPSAP